MTDRKCLAPMECMAGAGGFEPPYGGIKIRCLTAWRRPNSPLPENPSAMRADHRATAASSQYVSVIYLLLGVKDLPILGLLHSSGTALKR